MLSFSDQYNALIPPKTRQVDYVVSKSTEQQAANQQQSRKEPAITMSDWAAKRDGFTQDLHQQLHANQGASAAYADTSIKTSMTLKLGVA